MAVNGNTDLISVHLLSKVELCEVKQSQNGNTLAWTCQVRQDSREHAKVSNLSNTLAWTCQARQDSRGHATVINLRTVVTTWHGLAEQGGVVQRGR